MSCPLCGEDKRFDYLFTLPERRQFWECRNVDCGMVYVDNPEEVAGYAGYFDKPTDPDGIVRDLVAEFDARRSEMIPVRHSLEQRLGIKWEYKAPKVRVLDVGCGLGATLSVFAASLWKDDRPLANRWEVCGVEYVPEAAEFARKQVPNANIWTGDFLEYEGTAESFDLVIMWNVLEHLPKPLQALRKAHSLLKPGGILAIQTPDIDCKAYKVFGPQWRLLHDHTHVSMFGWYTIMRALVRVGFRDLSLSDFSYPFRGTRFCTPSAYWRMGIGVAKHRLSKIGIHLPQKVSPPWFGSLMVVTTRKGKDTSV